MIGRIGILQSNLLIQSLVLGLVVIKQIAYNMYNLQKCPKPRVVNHESGTQTGTRGMFNTEHARPVYGYSLILTAFLRTNDTSASKDIRGTFRIYEKGRQKQIKIQACFEYRY
jgi:hypothetical protein